MNVTFGTQDIYVSKNDGIVVFTYEERTPAESKFISKLGKNVAIARDRKEFSGNTVVPNIYFPAIRL
mgnify:CR=1 FL=1